MFWIVALLIAAFVFRDELLPAGCPGIGLNRWQYWHVSPDGLEWIGKQGERAPVKRMPQGFLLPPPPIPPCRPQGELGSEPPPGTQITLQPDNPDSLVIVQPDGSLIPASGA